MATGKAVNEFEISDVSEGCNYSDDITALKKNQSPDSMNIEFFNGRIRKRKGEMAFTVPPTGFGGIDTYTKLMLHCDGTNASTTFTDSESTPKTVTAHGEAQIYTAQSKFGSGCGLFTGQGINFFTMLMLHMNGTNGSTTFTDSSDYAATVTPNGSAQISTAQSKFKGSSGLFNGTTDSLSVPDSSNWDFEDQDFTIDFWVKAGTSSALMWFVGQTQLATGVNAWACQWNVDGTLSFSAQEITLGTPLAGYTTTAAVTLTDAFHHLAFVREGTNFYIFLDGVSQALTVSTPISTNLLGDSSGVLSIGQLAYSTGSRFFNGNLAEMRVSLGSLWTTNFAVPITSYSSGDSLTVPDSTDWSFGTGNFTIDFWVNFIDTGDDDQTFIGQYQDGDNFWAISKANTTNRLSMRFDIGGVAQASINARFSWSPVVGTWYHLAFVRNGPTALIFINGVSQSIFPGGTFSTNDVGNVAGSLYIGTGGGITDGYVSCYIDELRISKGVARWTTNFDLNLPSVAYDSFNASDPTPGFSLIDFSDTSDHHQQVAHFGNTVYAYDQMTSTSQTLRSGAPRIRSFNAKVGAYLMQTYSDYSAPYYWDGAASSMAIVSTNAPGFKRTIEFQGYMIGMNTSANPTRCYYQPIGNLLGGGAAYTDYFTLTPAPNDDEISDPFLLNGRLYAGTKYGIFRISFVGGVTVFEFKQVISDVGIVPGTSQTVITKQFGQVVLFLGTDKRIYMFDGANVKTISDLFYYHNRTTPIALDLIDDNYKENAFALYDITKRIYRLFVTKRSESNNNYAMNIDIDTFAYYPFDQMQFAAGTIGYDELLKPYVVCADYNGILHKMFVDTNTDNGAAINEYYTSPIVSVKDTTVKKGEVINLSMTPISGANLLVYDRVDYRRAWSLRQTIPLASSRDKFLGRSFVLGSSLLGSDREVISPQIAINATFNTYQFKLLCDTPISEAWEIYSMDVNQSILKFGSTEAQR